mgnify:CR=1 FL=1|tara:strand:+ start:113 stop:292 length:180 start_codon:yes stop_codon:yes gene_type:complete
MTEFDKKLKKKLDEYGISIDFDESIESMKSKNDEIKKRLSQLPDITVEELLKTMPGKKQ